MKSELEIREMIRRNEAQLKTVSSDQIKFLLMAHLEILNWVVMTDKEFSEYMRRQNVS
jgi:hypothetical protein